MNEPIFSTDKDALEKLTARLEAKEKAHEEMKKRNKYFRENCTMKGYPDMTDEQAAKIDARIANDYSWNKAPSPSWALSEDSQEITRLKRRIKELQREKERRDNGVETDYNTEGLGFEVVENEEIERLQIIYPGDGHVDSETYKALRSRGFVFSRTNTAFQRQLNEGSRRVAKWFIEDQRALQKKAEAEM